MTHNVFPKDNSWIPNPMRSEGEYTRFWHQDLAELDDIALESERSFILARNFGNGRTDWGDERLQVIDDELVRRRAERNGSERIYRHHHRGKGRRESPARPPGLY